MCLQFRSILKWIVRPASAPGAAWRDRDVLPREQGLSASFIEANRVTGQRTYLDWNATAVLREESRAAMHAAMELCGNPSSVHGEGRTARRLVEIAREQVAALIGAKPGNVVFTSGGSEANALALTPHIRVGGDSSLRDRLLVSAIEHASVLGGGRFGRNQIETFKAGPTGEIDLEDLASKLKGSERPLVSLMAANNETGVIQPLKAVADLVHGAGGILHVDAVQAAGRVPFDLEAAQADFVTISAHKIGGPTGTGALIKRGDACNIAEPLIRGGGQEGGARGGTENVLGIVGFGAAAKAVHRQLDAEQKRLRGLRDRLEAGLRAATPDVVIFGEQAERLPNTVLFALAGVKAETALIALDLDGVAVSSGSACSSGKVAPSHVLTAMGVSGALTSAAIRVSFGFSTNDNDIEVLLGAWKKHLETLAKHRQGIAA